MTDAILEIIDYNKVIVKEYFHTHLCFACSAEYNSQIMISRSLTSQNQT